MLVAPGVHHFDTGPFNWYLIEQDSRLTLVDAGFPGHYAVLRSGLASMGRSVRDIEAVVITHAHADHMGFAERVHRESGAPVYVHEADLEQATRPLQLPWWGLLSNAWRPYVASMLGHAIGAQVFSMARLTRPRVMRHDDVLDVPGSPRVLHVPGHTPGEVALHLPQRGILLSGDAIVTRDLMSGALGSPQIAHRMLNHDDRMSRRSLDQLRELGQVTLLPGHGEPWSGRMTDAIQEATRPRTRLVAGVGD